MLTAETCGASRSAVESAVEARLLAHGVHLREYKKPADSAREPGAASETLPQSEAAALETIVVGHYNGRIYPGYPEPEIAEAEQAFGLAAILIRHVDERCLSPSPHAGRQAMMRKRRNGHR